MKVKTSVSVEERHGQYYARWRSQELITNSKGEEVRKPYFEPTYVPLLPEGASKEDVLTRERFALSVGMYMAELTSPKRPPALLQQIKLREFAVRSSDASGSDQSLEEHISLFLIDYALTPTEMEGEIPLLMAVRNMVSSWGSILEKLGTDRRLHPSSIPTRRLQEVVDALKGKQERHAINLRAAYKYLQEKEVVLKGMNPAEEVVIKKGLKISRIPFEQFEIQRGLFYMNDIHNGDQWQLITLCGVYTPMRFSTACRLQLLSEGMVFPENPRRACSYLDSKQWHIRYYDTKGKQWETQILDAKFITWLVPYLEKHKLNPGDYLFPSFARLGSAPSIRWQQIMERSGTKMKYSKNGTCRTGYHALRISLDKWVKEKSDVLLTKEDIEVELLRHSAEVHRRSYDSGVANVAQQRRINDSRPSFSLGASGNDALLAQVRDRKNKLLAELKTAIQREEELQEIIVNEQNAAKTN